VSARLPGDGGSNLTNHDDISTGVRLVDAPSIEQSVDGRLNDFVQLEA
jgi:hypothetical protein